MRARLGHCIISPDPMDEVASNKFGVIFAPTAVYDVKGQTQRARSLAALPKTGLVLSHNLTVNWLGQGEADLTNRRVVFDRWAGKVFKVVYDGKEYEFISVSQWSVLAVIEETDK